MEYLLHDPVCRDENGTIVHIRTETIVSTIVHARDMLVCCWHDRTGKTPRCWLELNVQTGFTYSSFEDCESIVPSQRFTCPSRTCITFRKPFSKQQEDRVLGPLAVFS